MSEELAAITVDLDWAPDFAIEELINTLIDYQVKATWFITHKSKAVERLYEYPERFELGIHPNFLPGSTQGESPSEILAHLMELVPQARSMRTHSLVQSTHLLQRVMDETPVVNDVSLFLRHCPGLKSHRFYYAEKYLCRLPYFWEDDLEMEAPAPCWEVEPLLAMGNGLKIFDFHPMYLYLNCVNLAPGYNKLKNSNARLQDVTKQATDAYRRSGPGPQTLLRQLCRRLSDSGGGNLISELAAGEF